MNKDTFLKDLRKLPGWENMLRQGNAGVSIVYNEVTFLLFRDEASHFLKYEPKDKRQVKIIKEFNMLLEECREDIKAEMKLWNKKRLERDDNEGDPIV